MQLTARFSRRISLFDSVLLLPAGERIAERLRIAALLPGNQRSHVRAIQPLFGTRCFLVRPHLRGMVNLLHSADTRFARFFSFMHSLNSGVFVLILTDPLMAPLGMGLDYSYSVNERIRISGLMGDKMLQQPLICDCTGAWDVSDAINEEDPALGDAGLRATWWEAMTAMSAIVSGADMVIMRGPGAADMILGYCDELRDVI